MARVSSTTVVSRSQTVFFTEVDQDLVIMAPDHGEYVGLDEVGREIWNRLEHPIPVHALAAALAEIYDAPPERIEEDARSFLDQLHGKGLIVIHSP